MTAAPSQLREALSPLCMSSPRSSSLPSSSQLWAKATSSLNGVCRGDSTFQLLPYARYRRFRRCPDKVRLSAPRGDPGEVRREANNPACCARRAAPRHACRRTPLLRVNYAHAAAAAAIVFLIYYSNLPVPAEGRQLNRPTTWPCTGLQFILFHNNEFNDMNS